MTLLMYLLPTWGTLPSLYCNSYHGHRLSLHNRSKPLRTILSRQSRQELPQWSFMFCLMRNLKNNDTILQLSQLSKQGKDFPTSSLNAGTVITEETPGKLSRTPPIHSYASPKRVRVSYSPIHSYASEVSSPLKQPVKSYNTPIKDTDHYLGLQFSYKPSKDCMTDAAINSEKKVIMKTILSSCQEVDSSDG